MIISLFYVPFPTANIAEKVVHQLIQSRLIACGNIIQSQSQFIWLNELSSETEWVAIMKTMPELDNKIEEEIIKLHPYTTPAVIHWSVEVNETYGKWVQDSVIDQNV